MALDGSWNLKMNTPMGARDAAATLAQSGGALSGDMSGPLGNAPIEGTIDGSAVAFKATVNSPMGPLELKFTGTVDGDGMTGNVAFGAFGSGTFSGAKA